MPTARRTGPRCLLAALALLALAEQPVHGQPPPATLTLLQPVRGTLEEHDPEHRWAFQAFEGQRLSARIQANSGNLLPYMELWDQAGRTLAASVNSSFRNATIDDFVVPRTATYTLRVTAAPPTPTSGTYSLLLLPGYSYLLINDPVDANTPLRAWTEPNALSQISEGRLRLQLRLANRFTWTSADRLGTFRDLYVQAEGQAEGPGGYWELGLMVRGARQGNALDAYLFLVNSDGQWRFVRSQANRLTDIQEWTDLPTSLPDGPLRVGLMAEGSQFTLFYSGLPIATLADDVLADAGLVGVAIATGPAPFDFLSVAFDHFVVTLPAADGDAGQIITPPEMLQTWQGSPEEVITALHDARLIPGRGRLAFNIREAFVTNNTPGGIIFIPLARGIQFADLVYSADVTWESASEDVACALEFRAAGDQQFTIVYFDRKGGYGIRQVWDEDEPLAVYDLTDSLLTDNRATNRVTVVAIGNGLLVYLNGRLAASSHTAQVLGAVYIAAYNYAPASSVCRFNNVWLSSFDWH